MCLYSDDRAYDGYFKLKKDAIGRIGYSSLYKCTNVMRMLIYDTTSDLWEEYLWIPESTCLEAVVRFDTRVIKVFGPK